ncbi:MAG: polysaccharide biosynthesis/export family protein [Hyphomonadaceae bacterium]
MKAVFALLALLVCAGCTSSLADKVPLSTTNLAAPDSALLVLDDMKIAPLDVLEIKVFGSGELGGTYEVDTTGRIKFPLVGLMEAQGNTTFELAAILEKQLDEKYLRNPQVTVRIVEAKGRQITIEGAVGKQGMFPVRGSMTLLQALAISGGTTQGANLGGIIIIRTIEGQRKAARFDLRKIRAGDSVDPQVYGNDLIVVDGRDGDGTYDDLLRGLPVVGMFMTLF